MLRGLKSGRSNHQTEGVEVARRLSTASRLGCRTLPISQHVLAERTAAKCVATRDKGSPTVVGVKLEVFDEDVSHPSDNAMVIYSLTVALTVRRPAV